MVSCVKVLVIDICEAGKEALGLRRCFLYVYVLSLGTDGLPPADISRCPFVGGRDKSRHSSAQLLSRYDLLTEISPKSYKTP